MTHRIQFTSSAHKEFQRLPAHVQRRFRAALESLADVWPRTRPRQVKPLVGRSAWRLRVGDYRAIFEPEGDILVFTRFEHRSTAYRF